DEDLPQPVVFAQHDVAGDTISPSPSLYFYIPKSTTNPAVVTLNDPIGKTTLARKGFAQGFTKPGIYHVTFNDLSEPLKDGGVYEWTVSIRAKKAGNAHNAIALALMRYAVKPDLIEKLRGLDPEDRARVCADNSIWFDAIASLSEAI